MVDLWRELSPRPKRRPTRPPHDPDDTLSAQEELFVELYFQFNFNVRLAYERAGYSARSAGVHAYTKLNQVHIQAAIARRRAELKARMTITRDQKIQLLVECMTSSSATWRDRLMAIAMHSRYVGDLEIPNPAQLADPNAEVEITPGALRSCTSDELIEIINTGRISKIRTKVIDAGRVAAAPG